ncbi:hypothetical protein [Tabrizicola sp.]|uniref:hypothetical protein n=1 Tax=Tabrizicola sp. TaxID=2005166 RepID=UPI003F3E1D2E
MRNGSRLADIVEIALVHFWKALLVALVVAGAAYLALMSLVPVHEARSVLLVQLGRDYAYVPDAPVSGLRTPDPGDLDTYVNAEMQLLNSSRVREAALELLLANGTFKTGPGAERADLLAKMEDAIAINLITGSHLIDLRVRLPDEAEAKAIATALVDGYLDVRSSIIGVDPPEFLQTEVDGATRRLREIDEALVKLTGSASFEVLDRRVAVLTEQALAKKQELAETEADIRGLTARRDTLRTLQTAATAGPEAAQNDRAMLLLVDTEADLSAAMARGETLKAAGAALADELARLEAAGLDVAALRVDREATLSAITQLQSQLSASETSVARNAAGLGMVRVIEKGLAGTAPVGLPDRIKMIAAALLGVFAGLLAILLFEARAPRAHSAGIVAARFGVPVLGEIERRKAARRRRRT